MIIDWFDGYVLAHYPIVPQYFLNVHKIMRFLKVWAPLFGIKNRFQFIKNHRSLWYEKCTTRI